MQNAVIAEQKNVGEIKVGSIYEVSIVGMSSTFIGLLGQLGSSFYMVNINTGMIHCVGDIVAHKKLTVASNMVLNG